MLFKKCIVLGCIASAAMAQTTSIFCQARYITNVATCIIGVKECNVIETFSACVCNNTGQRERIRMCLIAMLSSPEFRGSLLLTDFQTIASLDGPKSEL